MYIMCFRVSIRFKMGILYCYCGIITRLVYPAELSRIAGFCTNSNKKFSGGGPQTPLSSRIIWGCIITIIQQNHLKKAKNTYPNPPIIFPANSRSKWSLCLIWKVHCWLFFSEWMFERTKKIPWKLLENVPQKSLKSPWKRFVMICGNHVFNFYNYFLWLRITNEGSIPEMRIWSKLLIKSALKWCIHLSRSLYLYFNYLVSVTAGVPRSPRGHT